MRTTPYMFEDRPDAGRQLADRLIRLTLEDPLVLALPRGGVPVGFEIARALGAPFDVVVVRKLGVPGYTKLAMGAIASGGVQVINDEIVGPLAIDRKTIDRVVAEEQRELARRELAYRGNLPPPEVRGRSVVLVDDGLATGATMRAAADSLSARGPARLIVAVPVGLRRSCVDIEPHVDRVICLEQPEPFFDVGHWYRDFAPTDDVEVRYLLAEAARGEVRLVNG